MKHTLILSGALLIMMAGCKQEKPAAKAEATDIIPVKVMALSEGRLSGTIEATGSFTTDDEVYLSFKTGGIINNTYVKEGDAVKAGQLLATLDLTEINTQVAQYKLGLEKAKRDYQRVSNLYKDSVATLEQLQNAKTAMDMAAQQLSAAEFNLGHSKITATQNGFVLKKLASAGQLTSAGAPVFLTNGAGKGKWVLKVALSDKQWGKIQVGDTADVSSDAQSGQLIRGKVIRKSEGVDPASGLLTADIQLTTDRSGGLAAGMFGRATIHYASKKAAGSKLYSIPYDAILDGDGRTAYVYVTNDNETAHKVKVTIESMKNDYVTVSEGLEDVQSIITTGSAYLTENSKIKIIQ